MLKRTFIICFIVLITFSIIPLSMIMDNDRQTSALQVRKGVMDLSGWNDVQSKKIKLDGEWEFYWDRLLTPEDFRQADFTERFAPAFMKVPSQWNGKIVGGISLPAYGAATYRMTLKNLPYSGTFALKKTNIRFSSTIYVNGYKLMEDGKPARTAANYRPGNIPEIGYFSTDKQEVEIIVQAANFDYINAGIPLSLYFGEQAAMTEYQQKSDAHEFTILAILCMLSLLYFICFVTAAFYRNKDYSLLFLSVICLHYAVYNGLIGERPLLLFVPDIPFEWFYKAKDVSSLTSVIVLAIFFRQLHRSMIPLRLTQAVTAVLGCFLVLVVLLPIRTYSVIHPYVIGFYELFIIWVLVRIALLHIKGIEGNRLKSFLLFMAILCINLYSLDIILFAFSLKETLWVGQFYIVVFNVMLILLVVQRFFEAYHTINEMKDRLLQLDKLKDDFLSNTSHELKTPLNAIVNITDTLLRGIEGPVTEGQAQNLALIAGSGRRLTHLVNELLDYSKMKHGDIVLYKSGLDLRAVVDSVVRIHLFLLGGKPLRLVNAIPEHFPTIYADGNRLIQILHNLIDNAIKFTDRGVVTINANVVRDGVEVRVEDTGIGIEPHMQERLFKAFEQADASETRHYGGTGLGLSITKKLVELHGGNIRIDSSPGEGSAFTFTLPLPLVPVTESAVEHAEGRSYNDMFLPSSKYPVYVNGERKERILVVDDDAANLQSITNLLRLEGYSFIVVNRGQLALEELSKAPDVFLAVLDVMMPDMSGYEVLKRIRERFSPIELPVLMLTAKNRAADTKLSMDNGANDFVGKPFEAEELMARVRSLTKLKASVQHAKNAEIAFLRSQIKPHFLYNALNSIASLCIGEPRKAEELTLQLSQYLRGSFDFKQLDSLTTVKKEMELVEAYVRIEQARFGERLQVEYDVDAHLDVRIPPLILQPLAENAIRHGLMTQPSGGKLTIAVKQRDRAEIRFVIEDNGCGMSEKKLEDVLNSGAEEKGVGLWNISRRLQLLYGRSLRIRSAEGQGTTVSFDIPARPIPNDP